MTFYEMAGHNGLILSAEALCDVPKSHVVACVELVISPLVHC